MAFLTPKKELQKHQQQQPTKKKRIKPEKQKQKQKKPSSWEQIKNLLSCKQIEVSSSVHDASSKASSKLGSSCSSICSFKDVVHGSTKVVHRADNTPESSSSRGQETALLRWKESSSGQSLAAGRSHGGTCNSYASRGMQFSKLSGCYECRMIVDPSRCPLPRSTICYCSHCGEVFPKIESLELHQKVRHAVSELGQEDSGRNIVEIIFKSSWLKKDTPIFKIERILKIHNTKRTIQRFEDYRDVVKARALHSNMKNPRCVADGNELLRFYCSTLACSLGSRGSSNLCTSIPDCGVCTIIRYGFHNNNNGELSQGVRTMASSGRAHDSLVGGNDIGCNRAMLVCRVIAGKVKCMANDQQLEDNTVISSLDVVSNLYDSVGGGAGIYINLEELFIFNPRAILPCFVVIYRTLES